MKICVETRTLYSDKDVLNKKKNYIYYCSNCWLKICSLKGVPVLFRTKVIMFLQELGLYELFN